MVSRAGERQLQWQDGCVVSVCADSLGFSPSLMKSCEAVSLDVRSHRSLNSYHTALTSLATGYIPPKLILARAMNKPLGHIVHVLLTMFVSVFVFSVQI